MLQVAEHLVRQVKDLLGSRVEAKEHLSAWDLVGNLSREFIKSLAGIIRI